MNIRVFLLAAVIASHAFAVPAVADEPYDAKAGSIDLHFGTWGLGTATTRNIDANAFANTVARDAQGRIVVAGEACIGERCGPVLMRHDRNGVPDTSGEWGEDAAVFLVDGSRVPDGSALVKLAPAGEDGWWVSWADFPANTVHVLRVDVDGRFVTGFAPGEVTFVADGPWSGGAGGLFESAEGKVRLVVGELNAASPRVRVIQLNETGNLEGEFAFQVDDNQFLIDSKQLNDGRLAVLVSVSPITTRFT